MLRWKSWPGGRVGPPQPDRMRAEIQGEPNVPEATPIPDTAGESPPPPISRRLGKMRSPGAVIRNLRRSGRIRQQYHSCRRGAFVSVSLSPGGSVTFDFEYQAADSRGLLPACRGEGREPDIGQSFLELICGVGWQATEEALEVGEGIDVLLPTGPFHQPNANGQLRCALRSDDTEARKEALRCFGRSDCARQAWERRTRCSVHTPKPLTESCGWKARPGPEESSVSCYAVQKLLLSNRCY
jgi:hypothetical protein